MDDKKKPPVLSPQDISARFAEAWNDRKPEKIAALFDEDADFVNVVGIWWQNRGEIYKAHEYGLRVIFKDSKLKTGKIKVKYLSDSVAVVHARMILRNQTPLKDSRPETRQTIFSFVVHRVDHDPDSSWSCASAHNTDIIPGKETHLMKDGEIEAVDYRKADGR